jgi:hypothetical protein
MMEHAMIMEKGTSASSNTTRAKRPLFCLSDKK